MHLICLQKMGKMAAKAAARAFVFPPGRRVQGGWKGKGAGEPPRSN